MLKKLVLLITILHTPVLAQSQKEPFISLQPCATYMEMAQQTSNHGETALFRGEALQIYAPTGQGHESQILFQVNQETGSWTLIALWPNDTACMIINGTKFEPYSPKKQEKNEEKG